MRLIFLAGLPRSGTTWVARALVTATRGNLAHEPFNLHRHPDRSGYRMKYMRAGTQDPEFTNILRQAVRNARPYHEITGSRVTPARPTSQEPESTNVMHKMRRKVLKRGKPLFDLAASRTTVLKEVFALLAIEKLWQDLQPATVILLRHPCALVSSWFSLQWRVEAGVQPLIDQLLAQQDLVDDHLGPFQSHLTSSNNYFFQLGAYWGATYYVLKRIAANHADWKWVTHESLCLQPEVAFRQLLADLGSGMAQEGADFLREFNRDWTQGEGPMSVARVTKDEVGKWKRILDEDQIRAVMEGVEPFGVAAEYYKGDDPLPQADHRLII